MHIGIHAKTNPDKPAVIFSKDGSSVTYRELNDRSMKISQFFRDHGLKIGDHIAIMMENDPAYLEFAWGAQRSGLYFTPINWHLAPEEAAYIINDCGAKILFCSHFIADLAEKLLPEIKNVQTKVMTGGTIPGFTSYEEILEKYPAEPVEPEIEGEFMYYSSGTTGWPKGILRPLENAPLGTPPNFVVLMRDAYGFGADSTYLCPAPLYHSAPIGWSMGTQRLGGTVVLMDRFDAESALALIEKHKVNRAQFVPTMFIRFLKLPDEVRLKYDVSSLGSAIHAAAPCPIDVKEKMIEWWGPILDEFYAGSEGNGFVMINSKDWLEHKGSVGKCVTAIVHIVGENGEEVKQGDIGVIYFEGERQFEYHNDKEKTADAYNAKGWSTLGDMGYLDEEGYLYLTDRKSNMIISGGVNIYPQEIENVLAMHPKILDVAVIGVPNEEFGEEVKAVIQPADTINDEEAVEKEIIDFCREHIAHYKCPKSVDFVEDFPRLPNGKLLKRQLRDTYWPTAGKAKI